MLSEMTNPIQGQSRGHNHKKCDRREMKYVGKVNGKIKLMMNLNCLM